MIIVFLAIDLEGKIKENEEKCKDLNNYIEEYKNFFLKESIFPFNYLFENLRFFTVLRRQSFCFERYATL
jgi:hypothetical protein